MKKDRVASIFLTAALISLGIGVVFLAYQRHDSPAFHIAAASATCLLGMFWTMKGSTFKIRFVGLLQIVTSGLLVAMYACPHLMK